MEPRFLPGRQADDAFLSRELPVARTACLIIVLLGLACRSGVRKDSAADTRGVRAVNEAYRVAWLAGDSAAVLRLLAPDAVLLPHLGDPPVVGLAAIRDFWWSPDAPPPPSPPWTSPPTAWK
jgi:hypothetical protein